MILDQVQDFFVKRRYAKHLLVVAFFLIVSVIIFRNYLNGPYLVGTDAMGTPAELEMMKADSLYFSTWRAFTSLGHLNFPSPTLSSAYYFLIQIMGLSPLVVAKVIVVGSFLASGILMYYCAWKIVGGFIGSFTAAVVYAFNQIFLSQITEVHYFFLLGYALIPLLFLIYYRALRDLSWRSAMILPAASLVYGTIAAPNLILITALFFFMFGIMNMVLVPKGERRTILVMGAVCLICVAAIILPTILMMSTGGGSTYLGTSYTLEDTRGLSSATIIQALDLASPENTFIYNTPGGQWTIPGFLWPIGLAVALVVPFVALCSIKVRSMRKLVLSLLVPALIFVFIAQAPSFPTSILFDWVFRNVPYVDSIRVFSRFLMLAGLAFALLIAIVIKNLDQFKVDPKATSTIRRRIRSWLVKDRRIVAVLIVLAMLWPSSAIFSGEVRGFDLPSSYSAPYEWLGNQSGDFRVLNLPLAELYYSEYEPRFDGYPSTPSLDVGIYSPLISHKAGAYGLETGDFWYFVQETENGHEYGYKNLSNLLGGAASVKYIVAQSYAGESQISDFQSMDGISIAGVFSGGSSVLLNTQYTSRVHGLESMVLSSGTRAIIPTSLGLGLVDFRSSGMVLMNQVTDRSALSNMFSLADTIIVSDGDVMDLMAQTSNWSDGQSFMLSSYGDKHTQDQWSTWVVSDTEYNQGYAANPTIATTGRTPLYIPVKTEGTGTYDLLLNVLYAPNAGTLDVRVDGKVVASIDPYSSQMQTGWVRISNITMNSTSMVALSNDGYGRSCVEQMIIAPHSTVENRLNDTYSVLDNYKNKVSYVISATQTQRWLPGTAFQTEGSEGTGMSGTLYVNAKNISSPADLILDPEASSGFARYSNLTGSRLVSSESYRSLVPGRDYTANVTLKTSNSTTDDMVCRVELWEPGKSSPIARLDIRGSDFTNASVYQTFSLDFTAPVNATSKGVEVRILTASENANISFDSLSIAQKGGVTPTLSLGFPFTGNYSLTVAAGALPLGNSTDGYIIVDGVKYQPAENLSGGLVRFDLQNISEGTHTVEVSYPMIYALSYELQNTPTSSNVINVTYERKSATDYDVSVSSDGPCWILLSENYNTLWDAEMDGQKLIQVEVDSVTNAFYVPEGGNHTITIHFLGQDAYSSMLWEMAYAVLGGTAILVVMTSPIFIRKFKIR